MLASLNHPNIAADLRRRGRWRRRHGARDGARRRRGPAPRLIARGPVAARRGAADRAADRRRARSRARAGIIHRDLKPANVKVRPTARSRCWTSVSRRRWSRDRRAAPTCRSSPTLTSPATRDGHDPRHRRLHGARAGARQGRRSSAPTSGPSASCSTRCSPGRAAFAGRRPLGHARGRPQDGAELACAAGRDAAGVSGGCCAAASKRIRASACSSIADARLELEESDLVAAIATSPSKAGGIRPSCRRGIVLAAVAATAAAMLLAGSWKPGAGGSTPGAATSPIRLTISLPPGDEVIDTNYLPFSRCRPTAPHRDSAYATATAICFFATCPTSIPSCSPTPKADGCRSSRQTGSGSASSQTPN